MYYLSTGGKLYVMCQKQLGRTKDGYVVYDHNIQNASYPDTMPDIVGMVQTLNQPICLQDIIMPFDVGKPQCVPTQEGDEVYYAQHKDEKRWSRFVKNKDPIPTRQVRLVLQKNRNDYLLVGFQLGSAIVAEPDQWDILQQEADPEKALQKSLLFWKQHAWVEGSIPIDPKTIQKETPWGNLRASRTQVAVNSVVSTKGQREYL